jgi:hypothetical protein
MTGIAPLKEPKTLPAHRNADLNTAAGVFVCGLAVVVGPPAFFVIFR